MFIHVPFPQKQNSLVSVLVRSWFSLQTSCFSTTHQGLSPGHRYVDLSCTRPVGLTLFWSFFAILSYCFIASLTPEKWCSSGTQNRDSSSSVETERTFPN